MVKHYVGNVKAGVFTSDEADMENLNDIEKVFGHIGIAIRDTASEMRNVDEILDELASKWDTLNDVEKNAVATAAAGTRQRENFLVLMNNYNNALALEEDSLNSAGTAAEKYEAYNNSLEASLNRVTTEFEELILQMEESNGIKVFTDAAAGILDFIGNAHILEGALTALALVLGKIAITGFINNFKAATTQMTNYGNVINTVRGQTAELTLDTMMYDANVKKLNATNLQRLMLDNKILDSIKNQADEMGDYVGTVIDVILQDKNLTEQERESIKVKVENAIASRTAASGVKAYGNESAKATPKLAGLTAGIKAMGKALIANPVTLIITAISAAVSVFNMVADAIETTSDKLEKVNEKLSESDSKIEEYDSKISELTSTIEELNEKKQDEGLTAAEQFDLQYAEDMLAYTKERLTQEQAINEELLKRQGLLAGEASKDQMKYEMSGIDEGTFEALDALFTGLPNALSGKGGVLSQYWDAELEKILNTTSEEYAVMQDYVQNYQKYADELSAIERQLQTNVSDQVRNDLEARKQELQELVSTGQSYYDTFQSYKSKVIENAGENSVAAAEMYKQELDLIYGAAEEGSQEYAKKEEEALDYAMGTLSEEQQRILGVLTEIESRTGNPPNWEAWLGKEEFAGLRNILEELGVDAEDFADRVSEMADEMHDAAVEAAELAVAQEDFAYSGYSDILGDYVDDLSEMSDRVEAAREAQQEFAETNEFSEETMKAIADNNLIPYYEDLKNANWDAGDAIYEEAAAAQYQALSNAKMEYASKLATIALAAQGDSAAISAAQQQAAADKSSVIASAVAGTIEPGMTATQVYNQLAAAFAAVAGGGEIPDNSQIMGWIEAANDAFNNAVNAINDMQVTIRTPKVNRSSRGGGGGGRSSGGGGSSSSSKEDTWKKAFEAEYDTLKHNREMDLISEEEYLNQLEALYKKYFAGRAEYLEDYRKYEEEVI